MSDAAIEQAQHDAARPAGLSLVDAFAARHDDGTDENTAFDRAVHAFESPVAAPEVPPPSYPPSPLALYSTHDAPARDANEILSNYASTLMRPRYDILVNFFRFLHMFLMLGGSAAAIGVVLYRRYMLPKFSQMIDARRALVKLQLEQFGKVIESALSLRKDRVDRLLPPNYTPEYVPAPAKVAEVVEKAPDGEEAAEGGQADEKTVQAPADTTAAAALDAPETEGDYENMDLSEPAQVLAPIDVTHSLRSALDTLHHTLRMAARAQSGERRAPTTTTVDEVDADDDGLIDLGTTESVSSFESEANSPIPPVAPPRAMRSLRGAMETLRNDVRARFLEEEEGLRAASSRYAAMTASSATPSASAEMQQVKAEIRSLKGLLLSRYVPPLTQPQLPCVYTLGTRRPYLPSERPADPVDDTHPLHIMLHAGA